MISELQVARGKTLVTRKKAVLLEGVLKKYLNDQGERCKVFSLQMYFFYHYMNFLSFLKLKVRFTQKSHQILILTLVTPGKIS